MKKTTLFIIMGLSLVLAGCVRQTPVDNQAPVDNQNLNQPEENIPAPAPPEINTPPGATEPIVVYKTRGDYNDLVPIELSEDKTIVVSYPSIRSVYYKGSLAYPTELDNGYLLDNRGVGQDSVFLDTTYEDFIEFSEQPTVEELFEMILYNDPFTEIYECKNLIKGRDGNEVRKINDLINTGRLSECQVIYIAPQAQIYTNNELGITFQYPHSSVVKLYPEAGFYGNALRVISSIDPQKDDPFFTDAIGPGPIGINRFPVTSDVEQYAEEQVGNNLTAISTQVAGYDAFRVTGVLGTTVDYYYFNANGYTWAIKYDAADINSQPTHDDFAQIVSSFEFIN